MIAVKGTYAVNKHFVDQNIKNINLFLKDFGPLNNDNFKYSIYLMEDKKTFVHLSEYKDEIAQQELLSVPTFYHSKATRLKFRSKTSGRDVKFNWSI